MIFDKIFIVNFVLKFVVLCFNSSFMCLDVRGYYEYVIGITLLLLLF